VQQRAGILLKLTYYSEIKNTKFLLSTKLPHVAGTAKNWPKVERMKAASSIIIAPMSTGRVIAQTQQPL
jgi:hypothetical protein